MRLFKENVLDRVKAYNLVALVDFIATTMDLFYKRKLREFYNSRDRRNHLYLKSAFKKADYLQKENIEIIDEYLFKVPSENTPGVFYTVSKMGAACNCKAGMIGKLCKHIAGVLKHFDFHSKVIPSVTIESCRTAAFIGLGKDSMPPAEYFLPLHVNEIKSTEQNEFVISEENVMDSNVLHPINENCIPNPQQDISHKICVPQPH